MVKSEDIKDLATALAKAQGQIKPAIEDSENPYFKSKYADLASVWEACRKPLSENGLSVVQTIDGDKLETILLHASGQFITSTIGITAKEQTSQAIGSAITYARRYSLSAMVGICPDEDDDAEAAMGREVKKAISEQDKRAEGATRQLKEHWCPIHKVVFFKKGNMKSFAHPITGEDGKPTGEWCNEKTPEPAPEIREAMQEAVNKADETATKGTETSHTPQGTALPASDDKSPTPQDGTLPAARIYKPEPEHKPCKTYGDLLNAGYTELKLMKAAVIKASGKTEAELLAPGTDYEAIYQAIKSQQK